MISSSNLKVAFTGMTNPKLEVVSTGKPMEDYAECVARKHFVKVFPSLDIETIFFSDESIESLVSKNQNKILILREFKDVHYEIISKELRDFTRDENQRCVHTELKKSNHNIFRQDYNLLEKFTNKQFAIDFVFVVIIDGKEYCRHSLETCGVEYEGPLSYVDNKAIVRYLRILESKTMKERSNITFLSHVDRERYKTRRLPMYFAKHFKRP